MALKDYKRKRHFDKTPEPEGKVSHSKTGRLYIIQKHAATRLHYDFRLELDGVLKSWAVPKGPSLDPSEKRLAVHVEDHPIDYGSFEGTIPEHEYGGGTVMLWDRGTWEPVGDPDEGYPKGRLKFILHGEKLRGSWTLVRMGRQQAGRENWLLIKEKDDQARPAGAKDILEEKPLSAATGRDLDQIAAKSGHVWTSNGEVRGLSPFRPEGSSNVPSQEAQVQPNPGEMGTDALRPRGRSKHGQTGTATKSPAPKARPVTREGKSPDVSTLTNARRAAQPDFIEPQLATLVKEVPRGEQWLHEIKFDGYRILAVLKGGEVRLITRHEQDWTARFAGIAEVLSKLPLDQAILDGEMVVLRPDGVSSFQAMQNLLRSGETTNLVYYVFDLPHCQGYDLTKTPLLKRKEFLRGILAGQTEDGPVRYSDHVSGKGDTVLQHACRLAMEGIICKRANAPYQSGRSQSWVKVKCIKRQEFVIGGYTDPSGARKGFGALLLGFYDKDDRLRYCGKVGTGFNAESLHQMHKQLSALKTDRPAFKNPPRGAAFRGGHWIRPELVAEIEFSEWTEDDILRHPSFQGLREDKSPREVVREEPQAGPDAKGGAGKAPSTSPERKRRVRVSGAAHAGSTRSRSGLAAPPRDVLRAVPTGLTVAGITLSNPDRILYPEQGITKEALARYYEQVADRILPHLAGRPLSLVRCPAGHEEGCFFQKHVSEHLPKAIRGIPIREKNEKGKYFAIDDLAGLISLVQIGVLEIHIWGSREGHVEQPDLIVFDLDPGPDVDWGDVVKAARLVRDVLAGLKLESFVKTSGGKGLHVVIPTKPGPDWDQVKAFTKLIATQIAEREPDKYTAIMSKSRRTSRIFIDYLRNSRGATSIAPYSTRARPGAPVSTPLRWDELARIKAANAFTIENLPKRLRSGKDPWEGFYDLRQSIKL